MISGGVEHVTMTCPSEVYSLAYLGLTSVNYSDLGSGSLAKVTDMLTR
jgi:hypothetical protein